MDVEAAVLETEHGAFQLGGHGPIRPGGQVPLLPLVEEDAQDLSIRVHHRSAVVVREQGLGQGHGQVETE